MKKKKLKCRLIIGFIISILLLISNIYFICSLLRLDGIETLIRILIIFILILLTFILIIRYIRSYYFKKKSFSIYSILFLIYSIIFIFVSNFLNDTLNTLTNLTSDKTMYSVSLVATQSNDKIEGIAGILSSNSNIQEYQIAEELAKENKINNLKQYDNYISLINALAEREVDYILLPSNYMIRFQNITGLKLDLKDTKVIASKSKEIKNEVSKKTLTEPFTILLMGVDSEAEDISGAAFNGDALMLITFNPKTLSTTILSIPRDSYVPIACFPNQRRNKITHAAWYGESCMVSTIENLFDIKIDYSVKINFKGVVKLVDALGGIELEIPYNFCEQNSNREWGENTIYVEEGLQILNGEQALAYSRNRHPNPEYCSSKWTNYESNDFIRGQHQQEVLKAILNKLKSVDFNTIYSLLETISNNLETNMSTSEILSLYDVIKDILTKSTGNLEELISMQRLYLSGIDAYIYEPTSGLSLYDYVLYEESIEEVGNAIKENLGLKSKEEIKKFSFDGEEEYEEKVIGKGKYNRLPDYKVLPDFIGDSEYQSSLTASNLGIRVNYIYDSNVSGEVGTVVKQNYTPGTLVSNISTLTLTIKKADPINDDEEILDNNEKENDNDIDEENNIEKSENIGIEDLIE